jgi:FkbH-like protein
LTTQRYSEAEISKLVENDGHLVLGCRAADKYGDMGIIGTVILTLSNQTAILDTMLLSCRALGRGIEQRFLNEAIALVKKRGALQMYGKYVPTSKNIQVEKFLDTQGFTLVETAKDGSKVYLLDIDKSHKIVRNHFSEVALPT